MIQAIGGKKETMKQKTKTTITSIVTMPKEDIENLLKRYVEKNVQKKVTDVQWVDDGLNFTLEPVIQDAENEVVTK